MMWEAQSETTLVIGPPASVKHCWTCYLLWTADPQAWCLAHCTVDPCDGDCVPLKWVTRSHSQPSCVSCEGSGLGSASNFSVMKQRYQFGPYPVNLIYLIQAPHLDKTAESSPCCCAQWVAGIWSRLAQETGSELRHATPGLQSFLTIVLSGSPSDSCKLSAATLRPDDEHFEKQAKHSQFSQCKKKEKRKKKTPRTCTQPQPQCKKAFAASRSVVNHKTLWV